MVCCLLCELYLNKAVFLNEGNNTLSSPYGKGWLGTSSERVYIKVLGTLCSAKQM